MLMRSFEGRFKTAPRSNLTARGCLPQRLQPRLSSIHTGRVAVVLMLRPRTKAQLELGSVCP